MPLTSVWALVPVKPLEQAKSRLANVLDFHQRADLVCAMLRRTLSVLTECAGLSGILVISADARLGELAQEYGARYLPEAPPFDLNVSLTTARDTAMQYGADGILIVPADLACISDDSISAVLSTAGEQSMVIVPDRLREGTNCLFVAPPDAFDLHFGVKSMSLHIAASYAVGLTMTVIEASPLSLDVDRPEDLADARCCLHSTSNGDQT